MSRLANTSEFLSLTLTPTKLSSMGPSPSCVDLSPCAIFEVMATVYGVCGAEGVHAAVYIVLLEHVNMT